MSIMQLAQRYFDAWNAQDAAGIVATFAPGGTYQDPTTPGPLTGETIGQYAAGLWAAFPDLGFEVVSAAPAGEGIIAAQWIMRGTNRGSMLGLPPTGKTVELPGADFVVLDETGIRSVTGYFDSALLPRQLGLQTIVQPETLGPFTFGTGSAAQKNNGVAPGALALTSLVLRDPSAREIVRNYARKIVPEMLQMNGFISFAGLTVGPRMITLTAWESSEDTKQLLRGGTHQESMRRFYSDDDYCGGVISLWRPARVLYHARCRTCGKMNRDGEPLTRCTACGSALSLPENTW